MIAPSNKLRKWFNHDPQKFPKFSKAYRKELAENPETPEFIAKITKKWHITILSYFIVLKIKSTNKLSTTQLPPRKIKH